MRHVGIWALVLVVASCSSPTDPELPQDAAAGDTEIIANDTQPQVDAWPEMRTDTLADLTDDGSRDSTNPPTDLRNGDSEASDAEPWDVVEFQDEPGVWGPVSVEVLLEATYSTPDITIPYQLLKLQAEGASPTYAQWFPPLPEEGKRPVMMVTRPYDGIDWTGDPVDEKWAARGPGAFDDDDEPSFGPGSSQIAYSTLPHLKAAEEATIYRIHKMGALFVYGRYYAGGSIWNEVDDMTTGLAFLGQREDVDTANIGVFGGSWGGFEALYAAAYAPSNAVPKVGVALAPLALMDQQLQYLNQILPSSGASQEILTQYETFFEPYVRRIFASTGGAPGEPGSDYGYWDAEALAQRNKSEFLLVHDEWDTLVPFVQSATLHQKNPELFHPLFMYQEAPRDFGTLPMSHGPMLTLEGKFPALYSFFYSFSLTRLLPTNETVLVLYDPDSIRLFFESVRSYQLAGRDVSWVAPLLVDMTQPNVTVVDASATTWTTKLGAQLVAEELNAVWGTSVTPGDVEDFLADGLPE